MNSEKDQEQIKKGSKTNLTQVQHDLRGAMRILPGVELGSKGSPEAQSMWLDNCIDSSLFSLHLKKRKAPSEQKELLKGQPMIMYSQHVYIGESFLTLLSSLGDYSRTLVYICPFLVLYLSFSFYYNSSSSHFYRDEKNVSQLLGRQLSF